MVSQDLLEILRCPACVREKDGLLDVVKDSGWCAGTAGANTLSGRTSRSC